MRTSISFRREDRGDGRVGLREWRGEEKEADRVKLESEMR